MRRQRGSSKRSPPTRRPHEKSRERRGVSQPHFAFVTTNTAIGAARVGLSSRVIDLLWVDAHVVVANKPSGLPRVPAVTRYAVVATSPVDRCAMRSARRRKSFAGTLSRAALLNSSKRFAQFEQGRCSI